MCYCLISETGKLVSKTLVEYVTRYDNMKSYIDSRVDDSNKNLIKWLDDGNFQGNSYVDGEFHFILQDEDIRKILGFNYPGSVTPTEEKYNDTIVEGLTNDKNGVIYKYLNMNLIFDVFMNDKPCRTVVKRSRGIYGRAIDCSYTNPLFYTCEYEIDFTDGTQNKYTAKKSRIIFM